MTEKLKTLTESQWDQTAGKKFRRNLAKSSQKNCKAKKSQNIYIKASLKVQNTYNKAGFKMAYIGENPRICSNKKEAQNIAVFFGCVRPPPKKNCRGPNCEISSHLVTLPKVKIKFRFESYLRFVQSGQFESIH